MYLNNEYRCISEKIYKILKVKYPLRYLINETNFHFDSISSVISLKKYVSIKITYTLFQQQAYKMIPKYINKTFDKGLIKLSQPDIKKLLNINKINENSF